MTSTAADSSLTREELLEQFAMSVETVGLSRTEARIFAAFVLSQQPSLSMGDLVEQLGISKGHASVSLRRLLDWGYATQAPVFGSKVRQYSLQLDAVARLFEASQLQTTVIVGHLDEILAFLGPLPSDHPAHVYRDFLICVNDEMQGIQGRVAARMAAMRAERER